MRIRGKDETRTDRWMKARALPCSGTFHIERERERVFLRVSELGDRHSQPLREVELLRATSWQGVARCPADAFVMESRTVNLVLRLLQRHLPVPWFAAVTKQGQLPGLLPRVPLSLHAPAVGAASQKLLDSAVPHPEGLLDSVDVERNLYGMFFKQPSSPFLSFDRAMDALRVQPPKLSVPRGSGVESPEPAWRFKLGLRLKSGLYMPTRQVEAGWEASSVKRKRKKKMNKHKQRKLRRRDRHRN